MIDFTIKTLESANHHFSVEDETTVAQLKERIRDEMGIEIGMQRLIFCGKVLTDEKRLAEFNVNGKVIHLVPRPPPSPQSRSSDQTQRRELREALDEAQRVIDRLTNQPTTSRPAREAWNSLPTPPGATLDFDQTSSLLPVTNRLEFIRRTFADIRQSLSALNLFVNGISAMDESDEQDSASGEAPAASEANVTVSGEAAEGMATATGEAAQALDDDAMRAFVASIPLPSPMDIELPIGPCPESAFYRVRTHGRASPDTASSSQQDMDSPGDESSGSPVNLPPPRPDPERHLPPLIGPRDLADLVVELIQLQTEFDPYRDAYVDILRRTDNSRINQAEVNRRHAVVELVCDVMHSLSHAFHAISDLDLSIGQHISRLNDGFAHQNTVHAQVNVVHATRMPPEAITLHRATGNGNRQASGGASPLIAAALRRANNIRANVPQGNAETNRNQAQTAAAPESVTYQVEARMPIRIPVDTTFINDLAASLQNVQNAFPGQSTQSGQNSQNQAQDENYGQNQASGQNQQEGATGGGTNQTQGQESAQPRQTVYRPRMLTEIENLVRNLTQAHPDLDVVMSMEEVHPLDSPIRISPEWAVPGPTNNAEGFGPDRDPMRPNYLPFGFSVNSSQANDQDSPQNGASSNSNGGNGSSNSSSDNNGSGGNFAGIRFAAPGFDDTPRFELPVHSTFSIAGDDGPPFQRVIVAPISPTSPEDNAYNSFLRNATSRQNGANTTAAAATTSSNTPPVVSSNNSSNSTTNATMGTTTTSDSNSGQQFGQNFNGSNNGHSMNGMNVGQPFTVHSHITYSISPDMLARAPINESWGLMPGQEIPQLIFVESRGGSGERNHGTGATRRNAGGDRRRNNNAQRRDRHRQNRTEHNSGSSRAHHNAMACMVYDQALSCDSVHARQRLADRRMTYNDQMRSRTARPAPTSIYRLEQRNYNFSARHMACMMRLLSGPISAEGRLNAFMVAVARVLYLEPSCRQRPLMSMPREFLFIRMQMREYVNRVVLAARQSAGSVDPLDRATSIIMRHHQVFLQRLSSFTTIHEHTDPIMMIRDWLRERIPTIIACIMSDATSDEFVAQFYSIFGRFYTDLCALGMQLCANGFEGFRLLYTAFIDDVTANFEETAQEWVRLLSRENLLGIQDTIDPVTPHSYGYQTHRMNRTTRTTTPPLPPARNDTPDTLESLPTMSSSSSETGSPPAREDDDNNSMDSMNSQDEDSIGDSASTSSQRSPVHMRSATTSPSHDNPFAYRADQSQTADTSQKGQLNTNTQRNVNPGSQAGYSGVKTYYPNAQQKEAEKKICPSFTRAPQSAPAELNRRDGSACSQDLAFHCRDGASHSRDGASHSRDGASHSHGGASHSRDGASHSRDGASHSRDGSSHSRDGSSYSQDGSSNSQYGSSHSQDGLSHSQDRATHSQDRGFHSQDGTSHSQDGASHSRDEASHSRDEASHSQNEASHCHDRATQSQNEASQSQNEASQSQDEASHIQDGTSHSRDEASHSRDEASNSQDEASNSQDGSAHIQEGTSHSQQCEASHSRQISTEFGNSHSELHRNKSLPPKLGGDSLSGLSLQGAQSEPALTASEDNDISSNTESTNRTMRHVATEPSLHAMRLHFDEQWLPVLSRDQRLQRERDRPQEPFSDAYLYGMPSSKRRCIRASRPPTTLNAFVHESVREATQSVSTVDVTQMRNHLLLDSSVRNRLLDTMRSYVRTRAEASEDFDPVRYSATARFIDQANPTVQTSNQPNETDTNQQPGTME